MVRRGRFKVKGRLSASLSCCQLRARSSWGFCRDTVNSSARSTSTWTTQSASTKQPRWHALSPYHSETKTCTSNKMAKVTFYRTWWHCALFLFSRLTVQRSWARSAKATSCSRCRLCWRRRDSRVCCWDHPVPDKSTPPLPRWLTAGETHPRRSWRPRWLDGCAPSTSPPECERGQWQTAAVKRRHGWAGGHESGHSSWWDQVCTSAHSQYPSRTLGRVSVLAGQFSVLYLVPKLRCRTWTVFSFYPAKASDEVSIMDHCCPLADTPPGGFSAAWTFNLWPNC